MSGPRPRGRQPAAAAAVDFFVRRPARAARTRTAADRARTSGCGRAARAATVAGAGGVHAAL